MRFTRLAVLLSTIIVSALSAAHAAEPNHTRTRDVIYGRKHGVVLTMDVFKPSKDANGAAIVWMVSGGWFSSHEMINVAFAQEYLNRGYTVFAVVHGSQPKYTIPECVADVNRAVRFIRHNAKEYGIDPERLGVTGASAGGHLSLMLGLAGDKGNPEARDPIDKVSSRVQAVACFFPPTDFLNYGETGKVALGRGTLENFKAPFDFMEMDSVTRSFVPVMQEQKRREIGKQISPVYHATSDDPPTLILHGDLDKLVPIQQAELVISKLKEAGVPAELVVKKGAAHGWPAIVQDTKTLADWFDKHLAKK